jgi:phosphotransferase system  glucose/maltose/N-acetylglucosamine-specific IIC component
MKQFHKIVIGYFVIALPLVSLAWLICPAIQSTAESWGSPALEWANAISGFLFGAWMVAALYIGVSLVVSKAFREQLLRKITGIKERDEREELIVARSARNTFLLTLGLLIFLFLLNVFQVRLAEVPPEKQFGGKKHEISLGLKLSPLESDSDPKAAPDGLRTQFHYDFPVSVSGILILLIAVQVGSFYIYSRRQQ